ncbi:hypothetical protein B0H19DRAFT_1225903 [Mycena capillaripes]|nr:hypothetical protein B0H19DRAFT_1225903 [Mycena capillaripes]
MPRMVWLMLYVRCILHPPVLRGQMTLCVCVPLVFFQSVRKVARVWSDGHVGAVCEPTPAPFQLLLVDCSTEEPPRVAGAAAAGIIRGVVWTRASGGGRSQQIGSVEADSSAPLVVLRNCPTALNADVLPDVPASRCTQGSVGGNCDIPSLVEADWCCAGVSTSLRKLTEPHGALLCEAAWALQFI